MFQVCAGLQASMSADRCLLDTHLIAGALKDIICVQQASADTVLTPRFYTTDFDQMEEMFNLERNPNLPMQEFEAMLSEFSTDYNQTHFVRNETFKKAAEGVQVLEAFTYTSLLSPPFFPSPLPTLCGFQWADPWEIGYRYIPLLAV